jgi:acyl dehydratase
MAINPEYVGKIFPPTEPYEVSREKLRQFADAIGDTNPVYRSRAAAQEAGFPDVIAPPTFPIVITVASSSKVLVDPGLNLNYAMVVHGEQRFEYSRPLVAGAVHDLKHQGRGQHVDDDDDHAYPHGRRRACLHGALHPG